MNTIEVKGLKFFVRDQTSDLKTIKEVIENDSYQKKMFKILKNEKWFDFGGNVGAFTVLAASKGAQVEVFEPDPFNCLMIKKNLELNNLKAVIHQKAVVHNDKKRETLNLWPDGQSWRNSLVRNKRGTNPIKVECVNIYKLLNENCNIKMDIEGSEIEILKNWPIKTSCQKLVFEWSFDVDPKTNTLKQALEALSKDFNELKYTSQIHKIQDWKFFPPCTMVHAWK